MVNGNANKVSRVLRGTITPGPMQSAVLACAIAYAAPLPVDVRGCVTTKAETFYNTNVYPRVVDIVSCVNEIHLVEVSLILDKVKETFLARVDAVCNPIIQPMSVTQSFTQTELSAVKSLVELMCCEFNGA